MNLNLDNWNITEETVVYNNELQSYRKENVSVKENGLIIEGKTEDGKYTSGKITSKFGVKYGKIEVKAKTNSKYGSFPAIWMLPVSGEKLPEINIFEHTGKNNTSYVVNHFEENGKHSRMFAT